MLDGGFVDLKEGQLHGGGPQYEAGPGAAKSGHRRERGQVENDDDEVDADDGEGMGDAPVEDGGHNGEENESAEGDDIGQADLETGHDPAPRLHRAPAPLRAPPRPFRSSNARTARRTASRIVDRGQNPSSRQIFDPS